MAIKKQTLENLAKSFADRFLREKDRALDLLVRFRIRNIFEVIMLFAAIAVLVSSCDRRVIMQQLLVERNLEQAVRKYAVVYRRVKVTCYNATIEQCDNTPWENASGRHVRFGDLALSRDLAKKIPEGSLCLIDGEPHYATDLMAHFATVKDTAGNIVRRIEQKYWVDILKISHNEAVNYGVQYHNLIVIPKGKLMPVPGFDLPDTRGVVVRATRGASLPTKEKK